MKSLSYTATISNGDVPDATPLNTKFNDVATLINSSKLDADNLANASPGMIIVTNSSGVPTWRGILGDITLSDTGLVRLAAENGGARGTGNVGPLTTTPASIPGLSYAPAVTGTFLIEAFVTLQMQGVAATTGPATAKFQAYYGATPLNGTGRLTHYFSLGSTSEIAEATVSQSWRATLTAGDTLTVKAFLGSATLATNASAIGASGDSFLQVVRIGV